jgi:hypothetical protein
MKHGVIAALAVTALICLAAPAVQALTAYSQDFEDLIQPDTTALANDGWWVYGNVSTPAGAYLYGYGPFPAPNDGFAFCQIDYDQGGVEQGFQQLVVFSDYNNADHVANIVESNVFHEQTITAADVGTVWTFAFQAKLGNLEDGSTAAAFIKTLNPAAGWALTNFISADMTAIPTTWGGYSVSIVIDASLSGQILQFGFMNTATNYEGSGVFYDNLDFHQVTTAAPDAARALDATLVRNYPNPFNPSTRIEFELGRAERVEVSVVDLAGRRVAVLLAADLPAGEHFATWNGRTDDGISAPAGQYFSVLKTAAGQVSRSMILLK